MAEGFYETSKALSEYLLFHYGKPEEVLPWDFGPSDALDYPARCVSECVAADRLGVNARALDLGRVKQLAKAPVLVDLRNIYKPDDMREAGFRYTSVGRE